MVGRVALITLIKLLPLIIFYSSLKSKLIIIQPLYPSRMDNEFPSRLKPCRG